MATNEKLSISIDMTELNKNIQTIIGQINGITGKIAPIRVRGNAKDVEDIKKQILSIPADKKVSVTLKSNSIEEANKAKLALAGIPNLTNVSVNVQTGTSIARIGFLGAAITGLRSSILLIQQAWGFLSSTITEAEESVTAIKRIDSVLISTGQSSLYTTEQLSNMASELSKVSKYDNNEILTGLTSTLLTFKSVGPEIFKPAQEAIADMSAMFGGDLQTNAIRLGKALNDPDAGVGSLSKIGIQFSDEQKKQIENYTKMGELVKAQKIIIDEVNSQVGGQSEANLTSTQKISKAWNDMKETIGLALLPLVDVISKGLPTFASIMNKITKSVGLLQLSMFATLFLMKNQIKSSIEMLKSKYDAIKLEKQEYYNYLNNIKAEIEILKIKRQNTAEIIKQNRLTLDNQMKDPNGNPDINLVSKNAELEAANVNRKMEMDGLERMLLVNRNAMIRHSGAWSTMVTTMKVAWASLTTFIQSTGWFIAISFLISFGNQLKITSGYADDFAGKAQAVLLAWLRASAWLGDIMISIINLFRSSTNQFDLTSNYIDKKINDMRSKSKKGMEENINGIIENKKREKLISDAKAAEDLERRNQLSIQLKKESQDKLDNLRKSLLSEGELLDNKLNEDLAIAGNDTELKIKIREKYDKDVRVILDKELAYVEKIRQDELKYELNISNESINQARIELAKKLDNENLSYNERINLLKEYNIEISEELDNAQSIELDNKELTELEKYNIELRYQKLKQDLLDAELKLIEDHNKSISSLKEKYLLDDLAQIDLKYKKELELAKGNQSLIDAINNKKQTEKDDLQIAKFKETPTMKLAIDPVQSGYDTMISRMLDGTSMLKKGWQDVAGSIVSSMSQAMSQMVKDYIVKNIIMSTFKKKQAAVDIATTATTTATETGIKTTGAIAAATAGIAADTAYTAATKVTWLTRMSMWVKEIFTKLNAFYAFLGPFAPVAAGATMVGIAAAAGVLIKKLGSAILGKGFKSGGYTGDGNPNEIAGVVHKGEYVIPANILRKANNMTINNSINEKILMEISNKLDRLDAINNNLVSQDRSVSVSIDSTKLARSVNRANTQLSKRGEI